HNSDDNLETLIFHIARGSGTKGLSGIAPVRDGKFIRPLLSCTSDEIRAFARDRGIDFVTDSTNLETVYTRNAIRHTVSPLLYQLNPRVSEAALRLSDAARLDCDFIEKEAEKILKEELTRERLASLHPALFQRVILALFKEKAGLCLDLSEKNIKDCRTLCLSTKSGSISLPHTLAFFADKNEVYIEKDPKYLAVDEKTASAPMELFPDIPLYFSDFCILLSEKGNYVSVIDENVYKLSLHERLDCGKMNGKLWIRPRRAGDTIRRGRMTKKLKKLLCDADVPQRMRDSLPIAEDSEGILYVPFVGARDGILADKNTERIINLIIFKKERTAP
ncbi:MAG: tRNA lysidine(34) synthetase TilS, partial [Clostridia bacterium]|nr:tRNA lysidine(34) synthetase TilS [Clostridia bacterium]